MDRKLFGPEHESFRSAVKAFLKREVVPHQERWREEGIVDREVWRKAGQAGLLCGWLSEAQGGPGGDFLFSVIVMEEMSAIYESGLNLSLHSDVVAPYLAKYCTPEQQKRWLPKVVSGDMVLSIAMTEPGTGSDLAAIQTRARRDGDHYVIDGAKTFITNGILSDLCVVAAKTESAGDAHGGLTLFGVEAGTPGYTKGKKLKKLGMVSNDTAELSFEGCRVPVANRIGNEGDGFKMLMSKLPQERLVVAIKSVSTAAQILADTLVYVRERKAFGKPISAFQNTQFELANCATEIEVGRSFVDRLIQKVVAGEELGAESAMAKVWATEMLGRVADRCLQLFGGYGYILEYPVARAYADARVQRIYAGTNEIMRVIIARSLGL